MSLTAAAMELLHKKHGFTWEEVLEVARACEPAQASRSMGQWTDGDVYVYVMAVDHDPEQDLIKVGVSNNPGYRRACLEKERGLNLYIAQTAGPYTRAGAMDIERKAHAVLAEHREQGEWFLCGKDRAMAVVKGLVEGTLQ